MYHMKIHTEEGDELADGYKFLNKPTDEQLLEKMEKEETELSEDEKTSLSIF